MGQPGLLEIIVIVVIIFVLFGAKKLPEIGKSIAQAIKKFKEENSADGQ